MSTRKKLILIALAGVTAAGVFVALAGPRTAEYVRTARAGAANNELAVHFLDVGQGDAVLIVTKSGTRVLIDGGEGRAVLKRLGEALPFYARTIDLVVLTHPHDDHAGGLVEVLKRYRVGQFVLSGVTHDSPSYLALLETLRAEGVPVSTALSGTAITLDASTTLEFLYPRRPLSGQAAANLNNTSVVTRLVYGDTVFLFMGDTETAVENELLAAGAVLSADVLKVAHHGSDTSSGEEFLAAVAPAIAVISVGADNSFGHPSLRTIKRLERAGAAVYRTDLEGTMTVVSDGRKVRILNNQ